MRRNGFKWVFLGLLSVNTFGENSVYNFFRTDRNPALFYKTADPLAKYPRMHTWTYPPVGTNNTGFFFAHGDAGRAFVPRFVQDGVLQDLIKQKGMERAVLYSCNQGKNIPYIAYSLRNLDRPASIIVSNGVVMNPSKVVSLKGTKAAFQYFFNRKNIKGLPIEESYSKITTSGNGKFFLGPLDQSDWKAMGFKGASHINQARTAPVPIQMAGPPTLAERIKYRFSRSLSNNGLSHTISSSSDLIHSARYYEPNALRRLNLRVASAAKIAAGGFYGIGGGFVGAGMFNQLAPNRFEDEFTMFGGHVGGSLGHSFYSTFGGRKGLFLKSFRKTVTNPSSLAFLGLVATADLTITAHEHASPDGYNPYKYPEMWQAHKQLPNYHSLYTPMGNSMTAKCTRELPESSDSFLEFLTKMIPNLSL